MIRVDVVCKAEYTDGRIADGVPKLSVFVGNINFESKEENLQVFFEIITAELGPHSGKDCRSSHTNCSQQGYSAWEGICICSIWAKMLVFIAAILFSSLS